MTNTNNTPTAPLSHAARLALYSNATPTINMPAAPADRSRNGLRTPRSPRRRIIR